MTNTSDFSEMKVLITGGAGFIGSNLAEALIERGCKVRVLDNLLTGHKENIEHLLDNPRFEFIEGDIRDYEMCSKAVKGCTHVSHQAALGSVPRSIDDPLLSLNINIIGTTNVFYAAMKEGIKRINFASSSSVYGDDETLPKLEEKTGTLLSPYAASKRSTELIQEAFVSSYNMEIIGFRYFNVFGPKQDPNGPYAAVIPKFVNMLQLGQQPKIFGDGEQSRDFTYISNVIDGNIRALITKDVDNVNGKVLNLAYGGTTSVNEIFAGIQKSLARYYPKVLEVKPIHTEKRKGDILHSHANVEKVSQHLGFDPKIGLHEGLDLTIDWYCRES